MLEQAFETTGDLSVPLSPIVAAGLGVEFVGEVALLEAGCEAAVWLEQGFLLSCCQVDVWCGRGICGLDQDKRITRTA